MRLVIDASVWVSAADASDPLSDASRRFLEVVAEHRLPVLLPGIARLEVACAIARRTRDAVQGRALTNTLFRAPFVTEKPVDRSLLARALETGTVCFLRGSDALYAAVASEHDGDLISWDAELIQRAGARSPSDWLKSFSQRRN